MGDAEELRARWKRFVDTYAPLRGALYRYCRHLTRSPWDAEDLVQDTLSRAFVMLAQMGAEPPNAQAWLFRVASNAWIDVMRRARVADAHLAEPAEAWPPDPRDVREAAGTLIGQLSPQERAAVVLKDAFELSLDEIAEILVTTPGAIKAALHRGRERLRETETRASAAPAVLHAFCAAFAARDLDAVTALLTETAVVEVVGATMEVGREAAKRTVLWGMMFGVEHLAGDQGALPVTPRLEVVRHRGEWIVLSWYAHHDGEAVRAVNRLAATPDGSAVTRLQNYFYNPEFIAEICEELGVPSRLNGHTYWKSRK